MSLNFNIDYAEAIFKEVETKYYAEDAKRRTPIPSESVFVFIGRTEWAALQGWLNLRDGYSTVFYKEPDVPGPPTSLYSHWRMLGFRVAINVRNESELRVSIKPEDKR